MAFITKYVVLVVFIILIYNNRMKCKEIFFFFCKFQIFNSVQFKCYVPTKIYTKCINNLIKNEKNCSNIMVRKDCKLHKTVYNPELDS